MEKLSYYNYILPEDPLPPLNSTPHYPSMVPVHTLANCNWDHNSGGVMAGLMQPITSFYWMQGTISPPAPLCFLGRGVEYVPVDGRVLRNQPPSTSKTAKGNTLWAPFGPYSILSLGTHKIFIFDVRQTTPPPFSATPAAVRSRRLVWYCPSTQGLVSGGFCFQWSMSNAASSLKLHRSFDSFRF